MTEQIINRRRFLLATAAATASRLAAQDVPDWGGNVLDIHQHARQQPGVDWTHMQGCGVTHAVLLTNVAAEANAKEEMAKRPDRLKRFVSVNPGAPDAIETLRKSVQGGAIGFGEMKSRLKADG